MSVVSFAPWLLYPRVKCPQCSLDRRLGGAQSRFGRGGRRKNSHHCPCPKLNPGRPTRSLISILTQLPRVLGSVSDFQNVLLTVYTVSDVARGAKLDHTTFAMHKLAQTVSGPFVFLRG